MDVIAWKKYLQSKNLYKGSLDSQYNPLFKKGMLYLEGKLAERVPVVEGMIWVNNQVNPTVSIADVEESWKLLSLGVADFDSLGPPDASDYIAPHFKGMFISQEDSKSNETDPSHNQNQGTWQSDVPENPGEAQSYEKEYNKIFPNITDKDPKKNSNTGSDKGNSSKNPDKTQCVISGDIDERMQQLTELINSLEK